MSITRPKAKASADAFISAAPDAAAEAVPRQPKYVKKGKKLQITLTIAQPLLERVDELAAKLGQSRAAVINLAVYQGLESGLSIDGARGE
jgi:gamma-glutamyl:cysteine ligase YbdK (ATP-grasp superfamily)